jgi:hypothetical protein
MKLAINLYVITKSRMGGTERRAQEVRISVSLQEVPGFKLGTEI